MLTTTAITALHFSRQRYNNNRKLQNLFEGNFNFFLKILYFSTKLTLRPGFAQVEPENQSCIYLPI
jgi:hypothetical protein